MSRTGLTVGASQDRSHHLDGITAFQCCLVCYRVWGAMILNTGEHWRIDANGKRLECHMRCISRLGIGRRQSVRQKASTLKSNVDNEMCGKVQSDDVEAS